MYSRNNGRWGGKLFWCGAFDMESHKVVEVHTYEEAMIRGFNSYWAFTDDDPVVADQLLSEGIWVFFTVSEVDGSISVGEEVCGDEPENFDREAVRKEIASQIQTRNGAHTKGATEVDCATYNGEKFSYGLTYVNESIDCILAVATAAEVEHAGGDPVLCLLGDSKYIIQDYNEQSQVFEEYEGFEVFHIKEDGSFEYWTAPSAMNETDNEMIGPNGTTTKAILRKITIDKK